MSVKYLLQLNNIFVSYDGVKALDDVSIKIVEGEIVAFMGANGAGKSTLLKTIFCMAPIKSGEILLKGHRVNLMPHELVKIGISFVPQGKRVFKNLTVKENIEIAGNFFKNQDLLSARLHSVLEVFPALRNKLNHKANQLSGGQQQMVALARGLITKPKILLLDEPSLGLSPKIVKEIFKKIKEINLKENTTIIIVEHNLKSLLEIVDRAYLFDKGRIILEGKGKRFLQGDTLKKSLTGNL